MDNFADRLISAIEKKGTPCVVGLDPRISDMPEFVRPPAGLDRDRAIRFVISRFHEVVIDAVYRSVPAVKLQVAFYEQYGIGGWLAFEDTIQKAKKRGLLVIVDAKRGDIDSTAEAYANAFLGRSSVFGETRPVFDGDALTVNPFLGRDSVTPFVEACQQYGKGIFILVKTSNPGSRDLQDQRVVGSGLRISEGLAMLVDELGDKIRGESGYSSIGAVVGATFPEEAATLRELMPKAYILVPGYGAQGGTGSSAVQCFNRDGMGAVVNASRSITYSFRDRDISVSDFQMLIENRVATMVDDVRAALEGAKDR